MPLALLLVIVFLASFIKRMVDIKTGLPLLIASALCAPLEAMITTRINMDLFIVILALVIFLAAIRMLFSKKIEPEARELFC